MAAASSPEQLQQLHQQLQQQIADSEFESAAETLPKILTFLEQLPDGWTDSNEWVQVVADVDDYLNALQPELEKTRDETSAAVTKIGKSKKGVRAYTK